MVAKAYPEEKVGVFAQRGAAVEVVEYSELDPQEAASIDPGSSRGTQPCSEISICRVSGFGTTLCEPDGMIKRSRDYPSTLLL